MRSIRPVLSLMLTTVWLGSCASTATQLPDIALPDLLAESQLQENQALATHSAHLDRLLNVGRKVLLANAELCPKTRPDLGVVMHTEESYPKELRLAAARVLGATEDPSILKIAADSPAARAGLRVGDSLILDGEAVGASDKGLLAFLEQGEVTLTVRRKDEDVAVTVKPDRVCRSQLRLRSSSAINAFANGKSITVTTGMMEFTQSDDELALIVGHELAHNSMGHIRKVVGNLILSGFALRYTRPFESEADYVGLYHMVRAGFDPDDVESFWRRLADVDPRSVHRAKTHPTFPDRYLRIAATRAEIKAKQDAREPLVPNFKADSDA